MNTYTKDQKLCLAAAVRFYLAHAAEDAERPNFVQTVLPPLLTELEGGVESGAVCKMHGTETGRWSSKANLAATRPVTEPISRLEDLAARYTEHGRFREQPPLSDEEVAHYLSLSDKDKKSYLKNIP